MGCEWTTYSLEDCLSALIDYRGKTPVKTDSGVPLVTAKIVKSGRIERPTEFISEADYPIWMKRGLPEVGDVVLTTEAPLGEVGQIRKLPVGLAQRIVTLRGKERLLDNGYLLYALQSEQMQARLRDRSSGTTVLGIKQSELRKVEIELPPFEYQQSIAVMLGCLDDRIDLLRQTNTTLEAIAQALFKSWFVDFGPVHAKAEGREPEAMDPATAALFPSEFEDSELGPIPKGWRVDEIGNAVKCLGGATPSTKEDAYWIDGEHHWVTPKDLAGLQAPVLTATSRRVTDAGLSRISSGLLPRGTLLMSSRAPIGYLAVAGIPTAINQGFIAMPPGGALPPVYLFFWTRANMDSVKQKANGSTFMEISKSAFRPIKLCVPPPRLVEAFVAVASPLMDRIEANEHHRVALTELRDTLLPRLISGKLRLPDVVEPTSVVVET